MAEAQVNMTAKDLQGMMEAVVTAMKKPTEAEQAKLDKERAEFLQKEKESLALAESEMKRIEMKRKNCAHMQRYKGQNFHGWNGQVNSGDNMVVPVCKFCQTSWPPFSAKLLPDEGRQGVNMEDWNECNSTVLTNLHKQTFPNGCERKGCFICYPKDKKS